ncbi:unnamed protein product [Mucor hiemalis]
MSKSQDIPKNEIDQVETVYQNENVSEDLSFKNYTEKEEQREKNKKKNIFIRFKDSIYHKPEKTENAWKLLTNLTNTQRITFAAAFFGWTLDAFDFFSVSLSATRIGK